MSKTNRTSDNLHLNRIRMTFSDPEVQHEHATFRHLHNVEFVKKTIQALFWVLFASIVTYQIIGSYNTSPRVLMIQALILVSIFIGGQVHPRIKSPHMFELFGTFIYGVVAALALCLIAFAMEDRRPHLVGIVYIVLFANSMMAYKFLSKVFITACVAGSFIGISEFHSVYRSGVRQIIYQNMFIGVSVSIAIAYLWEHAKIKSFLLHKQLQKEKSRADDLLRNILPEKVTNQLKASDDTSVIVDRFDHATVLFADIVGFTELSSNETPERLVEILNDVFSRFDAICKHHVVEKVKTIGDAYMVVSGVPTPQEDHCARLMNVAFEMREAIKRYRTVSGHDLHIRIGIHTGPLIAGIIGRYKFLYDLWGETVNTAARMESHGLTDEIQATEQVQNQLRNSYQFELRENIHIKGIGNMNVYVAKSPILKSIQDVAA